MSKPWLGLDLDGVVVNFNAMWIREVYELTGVCHDINDITEWDYRKKNVDMSGGAFWRFCEEVQLWRPDKVIPHAENLAAARILHKKWQIHVITSKPKWAQDDTVRWLREYSGIKYSDLTFTLSKYRIACDAYVDDSPSNLRDLAATRAREVQWSPTRAPKVYRQVRTWNRPVPGTIDLHSLEELL